MRSVRARLLSHFAIGVSTAALVLPAAAAAQDAAATVGQTGPSQTDPQPATADGAAGQGGLGDVILHPRFSQNGWIYLSYAEAGSGDEAAINGLTREDGRLGSDPADFND